MAQRVDVSRLSAMDWKRLRYGQGLGKAYAAFLTDAVRER